MISSKIKYAVMALAFCLSVTGCKKDNDNNQDDFSSTAEDIGQAESISSDVDNMVSQTRMSSFSHENAVDPSFDQFNFHSCATVTNDSVNHILTFDFGNGCVGMDGKTRSGIVTVNYSGTGYFDAGSSWTVSFTNFYVNGRHVEGTRSVINNGLNASGNMTWTIDAQNMKVTRTDGSWRSWSSTRTREMVSGYGDSTWTNDAYIVNGTLTGTNSSGESISSTLTNVRREMSCHYMTSGTMQVVPSNRPVRTIDFGSGTCDDIAIVTKNGITKTIHLHF